MLEFIPENWEPQKTGYLTREDTVGQLVESRFLADVAIGLCDKEDKYILVSSTQSDEEIRNTPVCEYENKTTWKGFKSATFPKFVVETGKGYSYVLCFDNFEREGAYLKFVEDIVKESDSIYYQLKNQIIEDGGNPDALFSTLSEEEKRMDLDDLRWTAWCGDRVYFPVQYDGYFSIGSVPRDPCKEKTFPVGGG